MTGSLGLALMLIGGFAILMMNVTGRVPRRFPRKPGSWTKHNDPKGWRRYLILYGAAAGAGALLTILHFGAGW
jgi:hypothetical protein